MNKSTKEKLRKHAIENGLGGYVEKEHICQQCGDDFKGTPNQLRCKDCIDNGYLLQCEYCNDEFYSKQKNGKYCPNCVENKVWIKSNRPDCVGKKISEAKKKFYNTDKGKKVAKANGKKISKSLKEYFKTDEGLQQIKETAKIQSKIMKEKIKNGNFTPNISNTFTHWDAIIQLDNGVKKFRSSWEACFWYCNQRLKYEKIRIPYVDKYGNEKTYIADFFDEYENILYEIKPKKYYLKQSHKMDKIIEYCKENDYTFKWINEFNILEHIDLNKFEGNNKEQLNKLLEGIDGKD